MKKSLKTGVAALLCLSALALSSCATVSTAGFTQNWYANNKLTQIVSGTNEKLVYDVAFSADETGNESYSVSYEPGTYTVQLSAEPDYRGKTAYKLTSVLEISGEYTREGESKPFSDKVESEYYFRSAKDSLNPVYSKKQVRSTSPVAEKANSLDEAVKSYDYVVECSYADGLKSMDVTYTDNLDDANSTEYTKKLKSSYQIIDNEGLLFAVRGLSSSTALSVFNPYTGELDTTGVSFATEASERTYTFAVGENEEAVHTLSAYAVNIGLIDTMSGKVHSAVYASADATGYRNVMLQLTSPLNYSLGSLVYTLKSATFANT